MVELQEFSESEAGNFRWIGDAKFDLWVVLYK